MRIVVDQIGHRRDFMKTKHKAQYLTVAGKRVVVLEERYYARLAFNRVCGSHQ